MPLRVLLTCRLCARCRDRQEARADQVGSFLRPPELLAARAAGAGRTRSACAALEDAHILRVLARQKELGFEVFTDGELRRRNFMSDFTDAVEGFDLGDAVARAVAGGRGQGRAGQQRGRRRDREAAAGAAADRPRAAVPEGPQPRRRSR